MPAAPRGVKPAVSTAIHGGKRGRRAGFRGPPLDRSLADPPARPFNPLLPRQSPAVSFPPPRQEEPPGGGAPSRTRGRDRAGSEGDGGRIWVLTEPWSGDRPLARAKSFNPAPGAP